LEEVCTAGHRGWEVSEGEDQEDEEGEEGEVVKGRECGRSRQGEGY